MKKQGLDFFPGLCSWPRNGWGEFSPLRIQRAWTPSAAGPQFMWKSICRIEFCFQSTKVALCTRVLFPWAGHARLHKHTWKSPARVCPAGWSEPLIAAEPWDLCLRQEDRSRGIYLLRGSWVSQETGKFRNPSQKWSCVEEETSCTWQAATKPERAVMDNGCICRKSTSYAPS